MKKWSVVILLALAQFIMVLDSTVMNVSISKIVTDLNTSVAGLQSAITFYTLTMAAFMMTGGKLGDKWGRLRAFKIGAIIYGLGSFITSISPSLTVLMFGWSLIEGLGAVLVIPAIAAIIASQYSGRDRVVGFAIIGGAAGVAVAAGPLIGGFMTTYLSWRYVFAAETIIMAGVLLFSRSIKDDSKANKLLHIDIKSVLLSALGMATLVFGLLQSKTWGWINPLAKPTIFGHEVAPFGISLVAYLILIGIFILSSFVKRQKQLEESGKNPLLRVSMLSIKPLRAGLLVLGSQYFITAAVFFVIPIYLQMVLGYDALTTGLRLLPMSASLIIFSVAGSRLITKFTPKKIIRGGQLLLVAGSFIILGAVNPSVEGALFDTGMFVLGAGLGLLASQIGNVTMSSVTQDQSSEVGGLQGTSQNLGASFGTALVGSIMIMLLTSTFVSSINNSSLPTQVKTYIQDNTQAGIPIVPADQVESYAISQGVPADQASQISNDYQSAQIDSLKQSLFLVTALALLSLLLSKNIPNKKVVITSPAKTTTS